ncbi:YIP1 family protein [Bacillus sp. AFS075034]|uniref:YIP1 family protein n=1 Tax=Bacillus sp. AFS075034 TaxID=2034281 RepID=UPI001596E6C5|nr:YIP1 family protein [Bacillus sp. AFS075034]
MKVELINKKSNPWFTIWIKPRETVRYMEENYSLIYIYILVAIGGISEALNVAALQNFGDRMSITSIIAYAFIMGPISGILGLYIFQFLFKWTGKWIGGKATSQELKYVFGAMKIPLIWYLLLWIPELSIFGTEPFYSEMKSVLNSDILLYVYIILGIIKVGLGMGIVLVLFVKCLSEVQQFSIWRAIGNILLSVVIVYLPICVISLFLHYTT